MLNNILGALRKTLVTTWRGGKAGKAIILLGLPLLSLCLCSGLLALIPGSAAPTPAPAALSNLATGPSLDQGDREVSPTATLIPTATTAPSPTPLPVDTATPTTLPSRTPTTAPTATSTHTPLPTATPTTPPTSTPTPAAPTAASAANLRAGPGTGYPLAGGVPAGQTLNIVGMNEEGNWYQLAAGAWIFAQLVADPPASAPIVAAPPTPTPLPQATQPPQPAAADVRITGMRRDGSAGRNEPDEYVQITNAGDAPQDMTGWRLISERGGDTAGQIFYFPGGFILQPGQTCRIYTNEIHPEYCGLSFNYTRSAIWNNNDPDAALLVNPAGQLVSRWQ